MTKLIINQLIIVLLCYVVDIVAIVIDLRAGIKKAKQRGEYRSSFGYRKTIEKTNKYFNFLLIGLLIDTIQITVCYSLKDQIGSNLPTIPFATIIMSLVVLLIEIKSLYEKAEDKTKKDIQGAVKTAQEVIKIMKQEGLLDKIGSIDADISDKDKNVNDIMQ